ncbi:Protein dead ringer -like protein [Trichinella patagoniensis]|uniref:Protein dead ringer-like protein n=1 Tax=Trichinella patagoniensis TaxID=990121 RepID=A0A0V0ZYP8_9BILA|nr:Protein dead ringer -like protein [Trichinella patagoniensis]
MAQSNNNFPISHRTVLRIGGLVSISRFDQPEINPYSNRRRRPRLHAVPLVRFSSFRSSMLFLPWSATLGTSSSSPFLPAFATTGSTSTNAVIPIQPVTSTTTTTAAAAAAAAAAVAAVAAAAACSSEKQSTGAVASESDRQAANPSIITATSLATTSKSDQRKYCSTPSSPANPTTVFSALLDAGVAQCSRNADIMSSMMNSFSYMSACHHPLMSRTSALPKELVGINLACSKLAKSRTFTDTSTTSPKNGDTDCTSGSAPLDLTTSSTSASSTQAPLAESQQSDEQVSQVEDAHVCKPTTDSSNDFRGFFVNGASSQPQTSWSFEEQFKQLYELSDDPKRKEFLDSLFNFMQRQGTPVTRIPIMAKQVLDLYELYRLVIAHGGLVEVINKKLWREITKGLHLPQSITSAAFTLRTQYMKYLYPYECEKERLSTMEELQAAIDGNRREGRRSSFNPFSQVSPTLLGRHLNGSLLSGNFQSSTQRGQNLHNKLIASDEDRLSSSTPTCSLVSHANLASALREQALAYENSQRHHFNQSPRAFTDSQQFTGSSQTSINSSDSDGSDETGPYMNPPKKLRIAESNLSSSLPVQHDRALNAAFGMPVAQIRAMNAAPYGEGSLLSENSLVVSIEINGILYQGVLLAQPTRNRIPTTGAN